MNRLVVVHEVDIAGIVESAVLRALEQAGRHDDDVLTLQAASDALGVKPETLRKKAARGLVPGAFKPAHGRRWMFRSGTLIGGCNG